MTKKNNFIKIKLTKKNFDQYNNIYFKVNRYHNGYMFFNKNVFIGYILYERDEYINNFSIKQYYRNKYGIERIMFDLANNDTKSFIMVLKNDKKLSTLLKNGFKVFRETDKQYLMHYNKQNII